MSKRHQASRRRTYGRRQHEIHERADRFDGPGVWIETSELQEVAGGWSHEPADRESGGSWLQARGID
jgi:hypothetical protein